MIPNTYKITYYPKIDNISTIKITSGESKSEVEEKISKNYQGNVRIVDITRIDR